MNYSARRLVARLLALIALIASAHARADLTSSVNVILSDPRLDHAEAGVQLLRLGDRPEASRVLYGRNDQVPLTPASNLKVVTSSAALERLGPDFKFRTRLVLHDHDLILVGDGDPSFGDAELLTRVGWDVDTVFTHWAERLGKLNVGPIRNVSVDDSIFDTQLFHPRWPANQWQNQYEAEVAGMNLNANCVDVFVRPTRRGAVVAWVCNPKTRYVQLDDQCVTGAGHPLLNRTLESGNQLTLRGAASAASTAPISITIHDPALYAASTLADVLTAHDLKPTGEIARDRTVRARLDKGPDNVQDPDWQLVAVHETPLTQVMARANKDSKNLYGECLCKRLGAEATGGPGSWENGTAAVGAFLKKIGVPENQFTLDDGCGLSKTNRITAAAMTQVLRYDYFSPNGKTFRDTLAVAGVDGTLQERFPNSPLRGRVMAKTGTVDGVSCLSGYLHGRDDQWYAFSIMLNNVPGGVGKGIQERIVTALDDSLPGPPRR
jgi:D-alanyl-D-alanine carboxypeptidase/D-alanyl-D-alanine-endopeptidase (penicillin-binding protein 4)